MKGKHAVKIITSLLVAVLILSSSLIYAADSEEISSVSGKNPFLSDFIYGEYVSSYYLYAQASDNLKPAEVSGDADYDINWHKVFGWSTLGMMAVTFGAVATTSAGVHCPLTIVTAGLGTATCVTGYYNYGSMISLTEGDWRYNTHAVLGTLGTIGFIATAAIGSRDGAGAHKGTGAASGVAFVFALGVVEF